MFIPQTADPIEIELRCHNSGKMRHIAIKSVHVRVAEEAKRLQAKRTLLNEADSDSHDL